MKHETIPGAIRSLLQARETVEAGWCQFALRDCNGRVCAMGALPFDGFHKAAFGHLKEALPVGLRRTTRGIVDFNNAPGRTKAEILALFDRAIELALAA